MPRSLLYRAASPLVILLIILFSPFLLLPGLFRRLKGSVSLPTDREALVLIPPDRPRPD